MADIQHQSGGGGWISGPMTTVPPQEPQFLEPLGSEIETGLAPSQSDRQPEYNPELLVRDATEILRQAGIEVDLAGRGQTATIAAADLLQAMGVRPASAPRRGTS